MKVLQINSFGNLSTGQMAINIYRTLVDYGYKGMIAYARNTVESDIPKIKISSNIEIIIDGVFTRLTDRAGFFSKRATTNLIKEIELYQPDIIHLHNMHGYYLNIELLFTYLETSGTPVIWTLHDCWAITGHCCHFDAIGCNKWRSRCCSCPQKSSYPTSFLKDNSLNNYLKKQKLFTGLHNITIVTVSKWLEDIVNSSFMKKLPVISIYNGIDLKIFRPIDSRFKIERGISDKKIILGVASTWAPNKRMCDFIALSNLINDDYIIVMIGLNKKQISRLPPNIIGIERTKTINELVQIYSSADVFFNSSIEEAFGLPTVEAMACGTPAIVYNCTALPELVPDGCGAIVSPKNVSQVWQVIKNICENHHYSQNKLMQNAINFDRNIQFQKYIELYRHVKMK